MFDEPFDDRVRVKICGITNKSDALAAIECGVDALGFNLWSGSRRYVDLETANEWLTVLPTNICRVAVMVNPTTDEAHRVASLPFFDLLQLHGDESSEFCGQLAKAGIRFAKAIAVTREMKFNEAPTFHTSLLVLDSLSEGKFGGTGRVFPWSLARNFIEAQPKFRVILAGGLTPDNVRQAVEEVQPFGVDVTTGVERFNGQKDHARMRAFVRAVRSFKP